MYFHFLNHIYITLHNNNIVILDIKNSKYIPVEEEYAELIIVLLTQRFKYIDDKFINCQNINFGISQEFIKGLIKKKILSPILHKSPYSLVLQNTMEPSDVLIDNNWRLPAESLNQKISLKYFLEAYFTLIKVNAILGCRGLYPIIKTIKFIKSKHTNYIQKADEDFKCLVHALNKACFFFPKSVQCLEWAIVLVIMSLRKKWRCNLVIGVQSFPFYAHAWVESAKGDVIFDSKDLPKTMSVILSEPFSN